MISRLPLAQFVGSVCLPSSRTAGEWVGHGIQRNRADCHRRRVEGSWWRKGVSVKWSDTRATIRRLSTRVNGLKRAHCTPNGRSAAIKPGSRMLSADGSTTGQFQRRVGVGRAGRPQGKSAQTDGRRPCSQRQRPHLNQRLPAPNNRANRCPNRPYCRSHWGLVRQIPKYKPSAKVNIPMPTRVRLSTSILHLTS